MYDAKREGKRKHNQICSPATMFLASKISYLLFPNLTHKTETGGETSNSNPPGPIDRLDS